MTRWDWEFLEQQNMSEVSFRLVRAQATALEQARKQVEQLTEALQFYASGTGSRDWNELGIEDNFGHKAREALKS